MKERRAHVVHVIHRLDTGGMENGLVNLVNRLPNDRFRHTIVPLTTSGSIAEKITNTEVSIESLGLAPGPLAFALPRLWRLFRRLRPSIVHTRNVGTLEAQLAAMLAAVPVRIHGEHGWEVHDLVGSNASLLRTRRMLRHCVHAQIALSRPTFDYLRDRVGVPATHLVSICNGVDTRQFRPAGPSEIDYRPPAATNGAESGQAPIVIGYVGRLADVKNPLLLVDAFEQLRSRLQTTDAVLARRLRLRIVGDGPLAGAVRSRLADYRLHDCVEILGDRNDVARWMRSFDIYALPSLAEGISNTLLEAMASGLACVATRVGGNAELIDDGVCGTLIASSDAPALAVAIGHYAHDPALRVLHGARARQRAVECFGIETMVAGYDALYTRLLLRRGIVTPNWAAA